PDRFFPVQDQALVVALAPETNVAFAADAEQIQQWIAAFERWGPVENVEPAPLSLARALGKTVRATFVVPAGAELGLIEVHAGRVEAARRTLPAAASADARALPNVSGLKGDFLAALGAARGVNSALDAMLLSDDGAARVKRRRGVRLSWTAAVCSLAFGLALWTVDRSRDRTLERIRSEVLQISPRAQEAMQLRERLAAIEREARAIGELAARRPDPLPVLAALSERLPAGAIVLSIKADGADWQIDGTASDAAALVPLLDRDNRFQDVRFLSASSRFQDGNRTAETFSIAFRVSAQP
ncbi:MAG: PilN domain-containing protein, partial [Longimicrobiales bacterium]